ncbi:hypothetical protein FA95DRAFT_1576924 [Auriscalpium vulgare]|uniref:Uncharacterized protein n=1 Tax=Auriscalpium vulgare TaxID=40419 RepID=A0ACB8R911_9AGAM|nr:hypothetical protein FA95DRAFT_1576924 [Auriscalpium vulgare]
MCSNIRARGQARNPSAALNCDLAVWENHGSEFKLLCRCASPLATAGVPAVSPRFQPAFYFAPAEVLVVEETVVEVELVDGGELGDEEVLGSGGENEEEQVDEEEHGPTDHDEGLLREQIDSAPKGQAYFAITRGFRVGVFPGPFERVGPLIEMYNGAHFCGFAGYLDAAAWFFEHVLD